MEENPVFYQFATLVCQLVLVPQWGMGVEVAAGYEKVSWLGGGRECPGQVMDRCPPPPRQLYLYGLLLQGRLVIFRESLIY